jgi:hypothetical protein
MSRTALFITAIACAFSPVRARAEFSNEWRAAAAATEAECAAFTDTLAEGDFALTPDGPLKRPAHPRGVPSRPHACIFVRFDINAAGETENIEAVFNAPGNLQYSYVREATKAVKKWRFKIPADAPLGSVNNYVEVVYIPREKWTYMYRLALLNGETRQALN